MFGLFNDKKIEKIAEAIDKEFKSIIKLAVKYNKNIKLSDFKKEYKSKKLKHGKHPYFASYKIAEWIILDLEDNIVPFYAEIQKDIVTGVRFHEIPNYYALEGSLSHATGLGGWSNPQVGVGNTSNQLDSPDISNSMKLKKLFIKKYKYEDMKIINPELWV